MSKTVPSAEMPEHLATAVARLRGPYIGGDFVAPTRAGTTTHVDPSSARAVGIAHIGGAAEIDDAVESARLAQRAWQKLPASRRAAVLHRFADLIQRDERALCDVLAIDAGVPASMGLSLATAWVHHYAGWADKITGVAGDPCRRVY